MDDYRDLSEWKQRKVDEKVLNEIEPKHHINNHNGFEWDEPEYTLFQIHKGNYCCVCWMEYYNCLCSHDN